MSLLVITCRQSRRCVFSGLSSSRVALRWLMLFVLLRLLQLNTDVDDAFLFRWRERQEHSARERMKILHALTFTDHQRR